jgi:O-succinylbenzoic acid--CoA ligase
MKLHKDFKLQGKSFKTVEEILLFSKNISEELYFFFEAWFDKNNFIEVKTSGSTGIPKVIQLQKSHMINSALATGRFFKLPKKTTALLCMSPNFIAGKMMLVRALTLGWHLDVVEAVSNPLQHLQKSYDFSAMVPLQLKSSLGDIHKVKQLIVGGGVVSNELQQEIQQVKTAIFATYGMTETITHIAVKKLNNFDKVISSAVEKSYYEILPNVSISTDDRNCLVINAPKVADKPIITNDIVAIISETTFEFLGRFDSVINSGGIKLIPEQI